MESLVATAVFTAVNEVNEQLPRAQRVTPALETALLGEQAALDSLALVNLIVCVEQRVEEATGVAVALGTDDTVFQQDGPMRSVGALIAHLVARLEEQSHV